MIRFKGSGVICVFLRVFESTPWIFVLHKLRNRVVQLTNGACGLCSSHMRGQRSLVWYNSSLLLNLSRFIGILFHRLARKISWLVYEVNSTPRGRSTRVFVWCCIGHDRGMSHWHHASLCAIIWYLLFLYGFCRTFLGRTWEFTTLCNSRGLVLDRTAVPYAILTHFVFVLNRMISISVFGSKRSPALKLASAEHAFLLFRQVFQLYSWT